MGRRKKQEPPVDEEASKEDMFKDIPPVDKKKVSDEFPEKEKKAKEEDKIVITPAVLPEKSAEEEEKIKITPAVLPEKPKEEPEAEPEEPPKSKDKVRDEFAEREKKEKEVEKIIIKPSVEIKMAAAPEPVISRRQKKRKRLLLLQLYCQRSLNLNPRVKKRKSLS